MDDFVDPLSSSTWPDSEGSSWNGKVAYQTSNVLPDSVEAYGEDKKNPSVCAISSGHANVIAAAEDLNRHRVTRSLMIHKILLSFSGKWLVHNLQPQSGAQTVSSRVLNS
ncbi:hypothetical protein OPV22_013045 [Ensete ventricosum]|uniref:Uncharacterized protein n=1 Tax=Ensete ventricosum TaxID=4639 RepID=A0AAV8QZZ3_ENSVE|nr:hypothetical protein OPV22_013045 [Ensete ventricosum]